jgi:signal transduction histidine kinase
MLMTAYADIHAAVQAINDGEVSRWLAKPWQHDELLQALETAVALARTRRVAATLQARLLGSGPAELAAALHEQLAHELASPLTLLGDVLEESRHKLAELRKETGASDQERRDWDAVDELQRDGLATVHQLTMICERYRSTCRKAVPEAAGACDAAAVVETIVRLLNHGLHTRVGIEVLCRDRPSVACDEVALGEILLNLLRNASEAVAQAGKGHTRVQLVQSASWASLIIEDTGPGLDPAIVDKLFSPGVTTKRDGSGVGLFVARALARQAGGDIVLRPSTTGARFEVMLPLARE